MKKTTLLFASLLVGGAAWAQTTVPPLLMKTPNEYRIVSASGNGKWACGVYADYSDERYGFLWNLESGEIELLNPANPSIAYSVSDDGLVVGQFTDNSYRKNGAPITMAGYWANHKWNRLEMPDGVDVSYSNAYSVSPDGHYVCGVVQNGDVYTGYVWKDGSIQRVLQNNNNTSMPYAISPDGQTVAGWAQDQNRSGCIWDADGKLTFLNPEYQSPWSSGRKFTHDGKKLLYFGGWEEQADGRYGAKVIYDVATGQHTTVMPAIESADFDVFDLSDKGTLMCENDERGYIFQDGNGSYADDYLMAKGVDLASEHVFMAPETDYYQVSRAASVSADDNVMGFLYYNDDKDSDGNYSVSMQSMVVKFNQPTTGLAPASVKASQMAGLASVIVSWKPNVASKGITGYNVYRDGAKVKSLATGNEYVDDAVDYGTHTYAVTAVYGTAESDKSQEAQVVVAKQELSVPQGLFAQQHGYNSAYVEWGNPATNFGSLTYFDTNTANVETFGLGVAGYSYETAILFDQTTLSAYKGQKISSVGFVPMEEQGGWKINMYTHNADGSLKKLYTQDVTQSLDYGSRNVVRLSTPLDVPSGDLLIALEVAVSEPSQSISALDYGSAVEGYSDLLRLTTEDNFYSIGQLMQDNNYLYEARWAIDATVAPAGADLSRDDVKEYRVFVDGAQAGTTSGSTFVVPALADGTHTIGVSTVYANGSESAQNTTTLAIQADMSQLKAVDKVDVAHSSATAINATWSRPESVDNVMLQYCSDTQSDAAIVAPASNNYAIMVGAIYPSKTFRGRDGYQIKAARFYPLSDASYTVMIYKGDNLVSEVEVDDYTLGQWNEVVLPEPIDVDSKSSYRLVIDCYDVTPESPAIALDNSASMTGYSDIYSLDGESWNPLSSSAVFYNWMIGLTLEDPNATAMPVAGYDVLIDGAKKNQDMLTSTSYAYDFGSEDNRQHTIRVNVYYNVSPTSVDGGITRFYLGTTGIADNSVGRIEVRQGDNEIVVSGDGVQKVDIVSASGATVASANGNTVSIDGLAAGAYVVKATVGGQTVTRKVAIVK